MVLAVTSLRNIVSYLLISCLPTYGKERSVSIKNDEAGEYLNLK